MLLFDKNEWPHAIICLLQYLLVSIIIISQADGHIYQLIINFQGLIQ